MGVSVTAANAQPRCDATSAAVASTVMIRGQSKIVYAIWAILAVAVIGSLVAGRWSNAFVALATLGLVLLPALAADRFAIHIPVSFIAAIVLFTFATLFLGEVFDFYERYWWWDVVMHGSSALGFGIVGFLLIFMLFEGDRYAAPPAAIALLSFCMAVTIGAVWELFEFAMDQFFGLNMQKSGLVDTMWDLIVDMIGAALAACTGYIYLRGRAPGGVRRVFDEFIAMNNAFYRKYRRKRRGRDGDGE